MSCSKELYQTATENFEGRKGDTFGAYPFCVKVPDTDLTGSSIEAYLTRARHSEVEYTFTTPVTVTSLGVIETSLYITDEETPDLEFSLYDLYIKVLLPSGVKYTVLKGSIKFHE